MTRRDQVLAALDRLGGDCYSREIAEAIEPDPRHLHTTVPWVGRELRMLAAEGVLVARVVRPSPDTYRGGMIRCYYRRAEP